MRRTAWSSTDSRSIDGSKNVAAVEERQTPIEATGVGTSQVAEGSVSGIGSGHSLEIVNAESDRIRRATCRADIGCGEASQGGSGTVPGGIGARTYRACQCRVWEEEAVRTAVNEARVSVWPAKLVVKLSEVQVEYGRSARKCIVGLRADAEDQLPAALDGRVGASRLVAATSLTAGSSTMTPLLSVGKLNTGFVTWWSGAESPAEVPHDTNVVLQVPPEEQR